MRDLLVNLSGGEIDREHQDAADFEKYRPSVVLAENVLVRITGNAEKRPGTEYVGDVLDDGNSGRLIPFVKGQDDALVLEMGHLEIQPQRADTLALAGDPIDTVFASGTHFELYHTQSGNVMYFTDRRNGMVPKSLVRFADDDWSMQDFSCVSGPWLNDNATAVTLNPSGVAGTVTVTASAPLFDADMVGGQFRFFESDYGIPYKAWAPETKQETSSPVVHYDGNVYEGNGNHTTSNSPPVHLSGAVSDGSDYMVWTYRHDFQGVARVTGVSGPSVATMAVTERLPSDLSTGFWAESAFSDYRGWPGLVGFFQQRLVFAATTHQPDTIFMSRTADYSPYEANFKPNRGNGEVLDDHAVTVTLANREVNRPGWLISSDALYLGLENEIAVLSGPSLMEPITPAVKVARAVRGAPGADIGVDACPCDISFVYVQRGGRRLTAVMPDDTTRELTKWARQAGAARFRELAWCAEPDMRLYALDRGGQVWACAYDERAEYNAFTRLSVGGSFDGRGAFVESICVAPDGEGHDRLWMIVKRTVDGSLKRTKERLGLPYREGYRAREDAHHLDAAVKVSRWNANPGQTVSVTWDGEAPTVSLSADTAGFFDGKAGETLFLRRRSLPPRETDSGVVAILEILPGASGLTATATIVVEPDAALTGVELSEWAWGDTGLSGLDHLEGESVLAWCDGIEYGPFAVSGGAIDIGEPFAEGWAGLAMGWTIRSHPLLLSGRRGSNRGSRTRISAVTLGFDAAGPGAVRGRVIVDGQEMSYAYFLARTDDDPLGQAPPLRSGHEKQAMSCNTGRDVQVELSGGGAGPLTLTSLEIDYVAD